MKKNIKKNTNKKFDLIINCVDCETSLDVVNAYINAKVKARKPITEDELEIVENRNPEYVCFPVFFKEVKTPWYKRFWNWLTRK